jgi:hypothetical protein
MVIEVTYGAKELRKKCFNCEYLKIEDESHGFDGVCICKENKVKHRYRSITDKACVFKREKDNYDDYCAVNNIDGYVFTATRNDLKTNTINYERIAEAIERMKKYPKESEKNEMDT